MGAAGRCPVADRCHATAGFGALGDRRSELAALDAGGTRVPGFGADRAGLMVVGTAVDRSVFALATNLGGLRSVAVL